MPAEFTCCECGRDIVLITADEPPPIRLCLMCIFLPGWFREPVLRRLVDPSHDGREPLIHPVLREEDLP